MIMGFLRAVFEPLPDNYCYSCAVEDTLICECCEMCYSCCDLEKEADYETAKVAKEEAEEREARVRSVQGNK